MLAIGKAATFEKLKSIAGNVRQIKIEVWKCADVKEMESHRISFYGVKTAYLEYNVRSGNVPQMQVVARNHNFAAVERFPLGNILPTVEKITVASLGDYFPLNGFHSQLLTLILKSKFPNNSDLDGFLKTNGQLATVSARFQWSDSNVKTLAASTRLSKLDVEFDGVIPETLTFPANSFQNVDSLTLSVSGSGERSQAEVSRAVDILKASKLLDGKLQSLRLTAFIGEADTWIPLIRTNVLLRELAIEQVTMNVKQLEDAICPLRDLGKLTIFYPTDDQSKYLIQFLNKETAKIPLVNAITDIQGYNVLNSYQNSITRSLRRYFLSKKIGFSVVVKLEPRKK